MLTFWSLTFPPEKPNQKTQNTVSDLLKLKLLSHNIYTNMKIKSIRVKPHYKKINLKQF